MSRRVLSLALKITGEASGLKLTAAERQLKALQTEADKVTKQFERFGDASSAAGKAQQAFATDLGFLTSLLNTDQINAKRFAEEFADIATAAKETAAAFEEGARVSEKYRTAEELRSREIDRLNELLKLGAIQQEDYNRAVADVSGANAEANRAAKEQADLLAEGAKISERYRTEEERRAAVIERFDVLLAAGAIQQEAYNRAVADVSGASAEAARAAKELADAQTKVSAESERISGAFSKFAGDSEAGARAQASFEAGVQSLAAAFESGAIGLEEFSSGFSKLSDAATKDLASLQKAARITASVRTDLERYDATVADLTESLQGGFINQETFNRAIEQASAKLSDADRAARGLAAQQQQIAADAGRTTLKFNELSGIFGVLPGRIGGVISRISSLASASEGLSRIFQGGLSQGVSSLIGSFTALINPVTLALGGIVAFAAGATSVARGLISLEDRFEKLGNLANQLGVSFEFVQVLEEAGRRTGVSIQQVSAAFQRLQRTLGDTGEESAKANKALANLGLSAKDLAGLSEDDRIRLIGQRIAAIEDPAKRSAAAFELFGRQGKALLPLFENLDKSEAAVKRFGSAISELDKQRLVDLGDSFDDIGTALIAFGQNLLLPFAGVVQGVSDVIASVIDAVSKAISPLLQRLQPVLDGLGQRFTAFAATIGESSKQIIAFFEPVGVAFQRTFEFLSTVAERVLPSINAAFESLSSVVSRLAQVASDSFNAIIGAFNEVFEAFGRLFGFEGISDFATAVGDAYNFIYSAVSPVIEAIGALLEVINRLTTIAIVAIGKFVATVVDLVNAFLKFTGLGSLIQAIGNTILSIFGSIGSVFSTIASAIGGVVGRLLRMAEGFLGIKRDAESAATGVETIADAAEKVNEKLAVSAEDQAKIAAEAERAAKAEKERLETVNRIIKANEEQIRIQEQFGGNASLARASDELDALVEESRRVQEALRAAREAGDQEAANAAASRLAVLDRVVEKQRETVAGIQEAAEQAALGFTQGFDSAFASVDRTFDTLSDKATQFGQEGFDAALRLKEGIEAAKEAVKDGILNREAFEQEVKRQKKLFEDRVKDLQNAEKIAQDIAKREETLRDRQFEIQREREEELANVRTGSIKVGDLRSGGISAFFDTLKEDPAIAEAKKQTKELEKVRKEIAKLNAEKVDILAGTG